MNLLATLTIGEPWYAQHTVPWMLRYALRCGADFEEVRERRTCALESPWAAWAKLDILRQFAEQSLYDRLFLIDADCVIMPHCPNLFAPTDHGIRVVADMGMPEVAARYVEWCGHYLGAIPGHHRYFNSGMMLFTREAARQIVPRLVGPYPDERHFEQDLLNLRIQEVYDVEFLPFSFNWLAPQDNATARSQNIVHFVGEHKRLIPDFCAGLAK